MKKRVYICFFALYLFFPNPTLSQEQKQFDRYSVIVKSLVQHQPMVFANSLATGTAIEVDGLRCVLANAHSLENARAISIVLSNGKEVKANLAWPQTLPKLGTLGDLDLAILVLDSKDYKKFEGQIFLSSNLFHHKEGPFNTLQKVEGWALDKTNQKSKIRLEWNTPKINKYRLTNDSGFLHLVQLEGQFAGHGSSGTTLFDEKGSPLGIIFHNFSKPIGDIPAGLMLVSAQSVAEFIEGFRQYNRSQGLTTLVKQ